MKVASTTTMTKLLNDAIKHHNIKDRQFKYETLEEDDYKMNVDYDTYNAEEWGDYNYKTGKYRVIKVLYPYEYYAMPSYLTTASLNALAKQHQGEYKNAEELAKIIIDAVEI